MKDFGSVLIFTPALSFLAALCCALVLRSRVSRFLGAFLSFLFGLAAFVLAVWLLASFSHEGGWIVMGAAMEFPLQLIGAAIGACLSFSAKSS